MLGCLMGIQMPVVANGAALTREEIQHFFTSGSSNSVRTQTWLRNYRDQEVTWTGSVSGLRYRPESQRLEVMIKVLPSSVLYDTVAILEVNTRIDSAIRKGSRVSFSGKIINGVDSWGVKEVQLLLPGPDHIQALP